MKVYKLTDEKGQTYGGMQWGENVTHTVEGLDPKLCSSSWIHFYSDPIIAILMNPAHANFTLTELWEAETGGIVLLEPLKGGAHTLTTIKELPLPEITLNQKIAFGILCAQKVAKTPRWIEWSIKWLAGKDRTKRSAYDAFYAASEAAAAYAASAAAYDVFYAASEAASGAVSDAAAAAAASAAYAANAASIKIDFIALAHEALKY